MQISEKTKKFILKNIEIECHEDNIYSIDASSFDMKNGVVMEKEIIDGNTHERIFYCMACNIEINSNDEMNSIMTHIHEKHPEVLE